MKQVNTTYWKVFRVGELFNIIGGKGITKNEIFEHQGALPAIQSGEENFGCIGYIDEDYCVKQKYTISKGECLTVARSGSSGYVGYQASQCVVGDSAKILEPKFEANTLRLLFIRSALMVNKAKYAYTDKVTNENYAKDIIKLPSTPDGSPDWKYMEEYMRRIEQRTQNAISALVASQNKPCKIDTTYWKEFIMEELFEKLDLRFWPKKFEKTKHVSTEKTKEFNIPLVNAKHSNNGIMYYGRETDFESEEMTIDIVADGAASTGDVYPQPQRTGVLYNAYLIKLKEKKSSKAVLCFLSTVIERCVKQKFGYDNKCTWDKLKQEKILLPATPAGDPDWRYMEMYMRGVEAIAKEKISLLTKKKQEPVQQTAINNYGTVNIYEK